MRYVILHFSLLLPCKSAQVNPQAQNFNPYQSEDSSSVLYFHSRSMDEVPSLFALTHKGEQDSGRIEQVQAREYHNGGSFLSQEKVDPKLPAQEKQAQNDLFFLFIILLPVLLIMVVAKSSFGRIQGAMRAVFVNRHSSIFIRTYSLSNHISTYIIIFTSAMVLSVTVWLKAVQDRNIDPADYAVSFAFIGGIVVVYYLYRYFLIGITRMLFQTHESTEQYLYRDFYTKTLISVALPPLLFAAAFTPFSVTMWLIAALLIVVVMIYSAILSLYTGISERTYGVFYFILYFCTVEIAPVIFGLKLLSERYAA